MTNRLFLILLLASPVWAAKNDTNEITDKLIPTLIQVESGGNPNAVGDNGEAVGILQQHKIFVDEVNRIINNTTWGKNHYFGVWEYSDRLNPVAAGIMAEIWFRYRIEHCGNSLEEAIRRYNAGKNWKGRQAGRYWLKVRAEMTGKMK